MKTDKALSPGEVAPPKRVETEADRRARLASYCINRGNARTLRRHLEEGLDPHAKYYDGKFDSTTLIDQAATFAELDCIKALEEAGARLSEDAILGLIHWKKNYDMVAHFLATGSFDPSGLMESGQPWAQRIRFLGPEAAEGFSRAVSEWERSKLAADTPPSSRRRTRFL